MRFYVNCIFFVLVWNSSFAQTKELQESQFDSLKIITCQLREQIVPLLSKAKARKVKKISDNFTSDRDFDAYSESSKYSITISKGCNNLIVSDIVADIISSPELKYVPSFHNLFMRLYPVLSPAVVPELAAELSNEEQNRYKKIKKLPTFYSRYRNYIEFIYLHEVSHVIENYDAQFASVDSKFSKGQINKMSRDSILLAYELNADIFAIRTLLALKRDPEKSFGVYRLMYYQRERQLNFITSIIDRAAIFYYDIMDAMECSKEKIKSVKCDEMLTKTSDLLLYSAFYPKFDQSRFSLTIDSVQNKKFSLETCVWIGNYYLLGTTNNIRNVEIAYGLFCNQPMTEEDVESMKIFKEPQDLRDLRNIEYTYYCSGKINELYFHDYKQAIEQFEAANEIALLMSNEYYLRLIERLKSIK